MTQMAMISPDEPRNYQTGWDESGARPTPIMDGNGWRVAQIVPVGQTFAMGEPIFWTECADEISQDTYVYNPDDQQFYLAQWELPASSTEQPATNGGIETL